MAKEELPELPDETVPVIVPESESAAEVALAHAILQWNAEEENARRLSNRASGILALVGALLGVGVLNAGELKPVSPTCVFNLARVHISASLLLAGCAVLKLLHPETRKRARPLASALLRLPEEAEPPSDIPADEARTVAFLKVTQAATELRRMNAKKQSDLDRGQGLLLLAGGAVGVAILCYLWGNPVTPAP